MLIGPDQIGDGRATREQGVDPTLTEAQVPVEGCPLVTGRVQGGSVGGRNHLHRLVGVLHALHHIARPVRFSCTGGPVEQDALAVHHQKFQVVPQPLVLG